MPIQSSRLVLDLAAFSVRLLEQQEISPRSRITAQTIAEALPGTAVNVYVTRSDAEGDAWTAVASAGEAAVAALPEATIPLQSGSLGILAKELKPLLVGAIEILSFENKLSEEQLESLGTVAEVASAALHTAKTYQEDQHNTLGSITRLTQLYDIEKVFSSTLEMDQLLPIIGSKVREMLDCEAVNLWLLEPDESLRLMHQAGADPTVREGASQRPGEGVAGDVSDNGEPVLIEHPEDARLVQRNGSIVEGGVVSLIVAPIMDQESLVGVIEASNRLDGTAFDDDDLFTLCRLTESAAIALHNASLLAAERKVEILETLVAVSHEITSTLDLDRVLQAVVNGPSTVIPYERAAIALEQRGRIQLRAISGVTEFNPADPQIEALSHILQWASLLREPSLISQHGEEIKA